MEEGPYHHSHGASAGLIVANNGTIRLFLDLAASGDHLQHISSDLRDLAANLAHRSSVPYRSLRRIWSSLPESSRPSIRSLFSGADFVFSPPKPREKSEVLKARLKKLEELAERKAYAELVKYVVPKDEVLEPFSSYKDQIGFGLHVVLMMFTGYLVSYAAFRALFDRSAVMNAAGGILGLVGGMLLETVLFILRTSNQDMAASKPTKLKKQQ